MGTGGRDRNPVTGRVASVACGTGAPVPPPAPGSLEEGSITMTDRVSCDDGALAVEVFELAMNSSLIGLVLAAPDGTFLRVNPAVCELFGRTVDQLTGMRWTDVTHPADLDADLAEVARMVRGDTDSYRTVKRYLRPDGSAVWGDMSATCLRHPDGGVRLFVTQVLDVTAHVLDEQELADSRRWYRMLAENASDVVSLADVDGCIQWVSPSVTDLLGYPPDALVGTRSFDLLHPDDMTSASEAASAIADGDTVNNVVRMRAADGSYRWIGISARPIRDDHGTITGRVAGWRDESSRVSAQQALVESEERYRLLAENASDVIITTGPDGRVEWVSPSVTEVLGWVPGDLLGRPLSSSLLHADDLTAPSLTNDAGRDEIRVRSSDGGWRWMHDVQRRLPDSTRVHALRDIHKEHEVREQLRYLATHDPLTQAVTRDVAMGALDTMQSHAARGDRRAAVLFLDVDGLKRVNDVYGHAVGDALLMEVVSQVRASIRTDDLVARFGGDEFVAILSEVAGEAEAAAVADKIHARLRRFGSATDAPQAVSVSIGVAVAETDEAPEALVRRADEAAYRAKQSGPGHTAGSRGQGPPSSP